MSGPTPWADLEALRSARLAPKPHQCMYRSLHQLALRTGELLASKAETAPKKRAFFRRNTVGKDKKPPGKLKQLLSKTKARSSRDFIPRNSNQEQETQQEEATDQFETHVAIRSFHTATNMLTTFGTTFAKTDRFVFHLASLRRMFVDLQAVGEKLEWVRKAAALSEKEVRDPQWKDGEWSWQKQLQADREQEETDLSNKAAKNALPFSRTMLPHEPMEALTLLKFEIDFFKADNSTKHVNSMKKVFFSVVRSSNGKVSRIPPWYIPPYALSYARDKGIVGSVGKSFHGVWVDKKSVKALKPEDGELKEVSRRVVVKRVIIHADAIETFRKEVELWHGLKNDNILELYGASHCSRPAILVTEEATHGSLITFLHQQRQQSRGNQRKQADSVDREWPYKNDRHAFWSLFLEAALGLQYLHQQKIVHGNLKSNNILLASDGHVKLTDFGLGMLTMQNQIVQDEEVEKKRQEEYEKQKKLGLPLKKRVPKEVPHFKDMGLRAPNFRAKKQLGRPTFQDDVYSFGLCLLDALVPGVSSVSRQQDSSSVKHVGDEGFDPTAGLESVAGKINADDRMLVLDMCQENPTERSPLEEVISRMEKLRDAAAEERAGSSECCMM